MTITILGGGLSGLALANFLQENKEIDRIDILEKDDEIGGLCRSIKKDGYIYDIGPHILFSKDKEMLDLMLSVVPKHNELRRSNQIIYKERWIQYPFENDLSKLPEKELRYCVTEFQNNPYREYPAENMLQFFLKTFGAGITNMYLRPYNEKIWKYDPAFMDTQMVERIPQPTDEEILRSAKGETVDGYVHQLYFSYPSKGGIESVVQGFASRLSDKCHIHIKSKVTYVKKQDGCFSVRTAAGEEFSSDDLISTIPVQEFTAAYADVPKRMRDRVSDLKYNSIIVALVKTKTDMSGDNFAFMNSEKNVIFHRISKLDFLGSAYQSDGATYIVEVTYRQGDYTDGLSDKELRNKITDGILSIGFAGERSDVSILNITRHKYAYVIYDLKHKNNMTEIRDFYAKEGIRLNGRFGNFEYWNMDKILREAKTMAEDIYDKRG